jgi:hypothetical protein
LAGLGVVVVALAAVGSMLGFGIAPMGFVVVALAGSGVALVGFATVGRLVEVGIVSVMGTSTLDMVQGYTI